MAVATPSSLLLMLLLLGGGMPLPLGVPPLPEDPVLAQVAPAECLFYMSSAGMAEPDRASKNQTEQLMAEPEVRHFAAEIERLIAAKVREEAARGGPQQAALAEDAVVWVKTLLTRPTAVFVSDVNMTQKRPDFRAGLLVNLGPDAAKIQAALEKHQAALGIAVQKVEIGGVTCYRLTFSPDAPQITWGIQGRYFVGGLGEGTVEGILQRTRGKAPAWLAAVRKQLPVERVSTVTYVNVKKLVEQFVPMGGPKAKLVVDSLGLSNVTSLASVAGLEGEGLVSRTLIAVEGQPAGVFAALGQKPLTARDLAPIPRDANLAGVKRFDAVVAMDTLLAIVGKIDARERQEMARGLEAMKQKLGADLRDDVLKSLGDVWCVYNSPGEGGLLVTGLTAVVPVKDHQRLAAAHAKLLAAATAALQEEAKPPLKKPARKLTPEEAEEAEEKAPPPVRAYYGPRPWIEQFRFAGQDVQVFHPGDAPFAPAWCLTEKELIVALFPQQVKAYLSRGAEFRSLAEVTDVAKVLKGAEGPIALGYSDLRNMLELAYPIIGMGLESAAGGMRREGIKFSASILPSAPVIYRHARPNVMVARRTQAGIEIESRGTVPGASVAPVASLAPWFLLAVRASPVPPAPIEQAVPQSIEAFERVPKAPATESAPEDPKP